MVLTASSPPSTLQGMFGSPPKRGATLPKYLSGSNAAIDSASAAGHKKTTRSNTLPSHVATMNNNNRDEGNYRVLMIFFSIFLYTTIQGGPTEFTQEIAVLCLLFERTFSNSTMTSVKNPIKYFNFRCKIQVDHPTVSLT